MNKIWAGDSKGEKFINEWRCYDVEADLHIPYSLWEYFHQRAKFYFLDDIKKEENKMTKAKLEKI
jgi:hypothetical protein